jgi:cytidylate kinase
MATITVSRLFGSGGEEIAMRVCELLGYRYFDSQLMAQFAADTGLTDDKFANVLEDRQITVLQNTIRAAYRQGNLVVLGRGSQVLLKDNPDVLHVRVVASLERRIERVRERMHTDSEGAWQMIFQRDEGSAGYLKRFYHVDWADPALYHMVLNTDRVTTEMAAQIIVTAVNHLPLPVVAQA